MERLTNSVSESFLDQSEELFGNRPKIKAKLNEEIKEAFIDNDESQRKPRYFRDDSVLYLKENTDHIEDPAARRRIEKHKIKSLVPPKYKKDATHNIYVTIPKTETLN